MRKSLLLLTSACTLFLSAAAFAHPSTDIPVLGTPVKTPPRGLITPANTHYNLMTLSVGAQAELAYNSNIYRSETDKRSDLIATFAPRLGLKSNFEKHRLDITITPEAGHYFSNARNDYLDWDARLRGRYDVSETDAAHIDARYRYGHMNIGASDDDPTSNLKSPVTYNHYEAGAQWVSNKDLLHYEAGAHLSKQDYNNARRRDNSINIQDDRDRTVYDLTGKIGYKFLNPYLLYIKGAFNNRRYDKRIDSSLLHTRDSRGYEIAVGLGREPSDQPFDFDIYVGYFAQNYDARALPDVFSGDLGARLSWKISPDSLLALTLDREIKDASTVGVSSILQTTTGAEYTHNYSDELSLGATLAYTHSNHQTNRALTALDREDNLYSAGLHALYTPYKDTSLRAGYTVNTRRSNQSLSDYYAHMIGLTGTIKY